jgi:hypothetical protein
MHQNNIYFYFKKNYLWYQHIKMIRKHQKHINLKQRKKNQFKFFQKCFWNAKINRILQNSVKKVCENCFIKTVFQTQFFSGFRSTKYNLVCYQSPYYYVCFIAYTKTSKKKSTLLFKLKMGSWKKKKKLKGNQMQV